MDLHVPALCDVEVTSALRDVLSAYDTTYVALAEGLGADLIAADRRLARGCDFVGISCIS